MHYLFTFIENFMHAYLQFQQRIALGLKLLRGTGESLVQTGRAPDSLTLQTKDAVGLGSAGFPHWLLSSSLLLSLVCRRPHIPYSVKSFLQWEKSSLFLQTGFMAVCLLLLTPDSHPSTPGPLCFGCHFLN